MGGQSLKFPVMHKSKAFGNHRSKGKVIIYFEFSHCGPRTADEMKVWGHLLTLCRQQVIKVLLLRWPKEAGCWNLDFGQSEPTILGCSKDSGYFLNTTVPAQEMGEMMQSARCVGLE